MKVLLLWLLVVLEVVIDASLYYVGGVVLQLVFAPVLFVTTYSAMMHTLTPMWRP